MRRARPSPRIPRDVPVSAKQPDPRRSSSHLAAIRQLPCIACGREGETEAAHIRTGTDGGMGVKPHDKFTVPLCRDCHRQQHQVGELTFWSDIGIDPTGPAEALWSNSTKPDAMRRIVERNLQPIARKRA